MNKKITELTTYAQNREDLYLYALLCDVKKGLYVDVGANHEELHSVTKMFYEIGWKGINIDPNPNLIGEYKSKRSRDVNLNIALGSKNGEMIFREYPEHDGLSTLSEEIKNLNSKNNIPFKDYTVKVTTLEDIFTKHCSNKVIDFLKVDVEGHELEVLKGNNWKKFKPRVVTFEGTSREACIKFMETKGYKVEFFDGLNYYLILKNDKKSNIHNFAGSVLTKGIYTGREKQLIRSRAASNANSQPGIKNSCSALVFALRRRLTNKVK
jgi:FkbM family methyltransferase